MKIEQSVIEKIQPAVTALGYEIVDVEFEKKNGEDNLTIFIDIPSPGLDRPFKKQRDYERNYGKEVEIKLYAPLKGKKVYEGVLVARDENSLTLNLGKEEIKIENNKIAIARPLVKFE